jgi:hypothetical protein
VVITAVTIFSNRGNTIQPRRSQSVLYNTIRLVFKVFALQGYRITLMNTDVLKDIEINKKNALK